MNTSDQLFASEKLKASLMRLLPLVIILFGLLIMYVPTFVGLFRDVWSSEKQAHGPIVLAIATWFFYFRAKSLPSANIPFGSSPMAGWILIIIGAIFYVVGRSQSVYLLEVSSFLMFLLGLMLIFMGSKVAGYFWFAFFFLLFIVPLPGSIVDVATQPMKIAVSYASENLLHFFGYPIARAGVILYIGQYQLLVADACAGLNSLFTLEALGLLYLNVVRHESPLRNAILAILIVPIAFTSNVTRVIILSLITYYWGDAAGQGFLHEFSGMVLFITALFIIIGVDAVLRAISQRWSKQT